MIEVENTDVNIVRNLIPMRQGWVGTGKSRDETRRDRDNVLKCFQDKTRLAFKTRQIDSRHIKTVKGMSRQDKAFKFSEI